MRHAQQQLDTARPRAPRQARGDQSAEDYAAAIAALQQQHGEARVRDLATLMGVSHVTVSRIITRLAGLGLVEARPHKPVMLTRAGLHLAARVQRRRDAVLACLLSLGVPRRQAEADAAGIAHHASEATLRAMNRHTRVAPEHPTAPTPSPVLGSTP